MNAFIYHFGFELANHGPHHPGFPRNNDPSNGGSRHHGRYNLVVAGTIGNSP